MPDRLWRIFQKVTRESPVLAQACDRRRHDDCAALPSVPVVATSGCTSRQLPPIFGTSWQTVHRRFTERSKTRRCRI
ncbi:transposase [Streptomyces sparsogenes]|uniref:transposase n=1 Tax=Streptomyces sparsogenes TaxID=67365 RepID=UPI003322ABA8